MAGNQNERIAAERKRTTGNMWVWIIGALALLAIALFLLVPVFNRPVAATPGNATIAEITGGLGSYAGQSVLLSGEVREVVSPNAFVLHGEARDAAAADASILVVGAEQNLAAIDDQLLNDRVLAGGIVREFDLATIEDEVGYDLDDALFADWDGRPVLVATAIQRAGAPASSAANVTISEIMQTPDQYLGTNAIVAGQAIDLLTPDAVVLVDPAEANADPVDAGLLVLSAEQGLWGELDETILNRRALAAGIVRNVDIAALEAELGYDLDDALLEPYVGKPALIATAFQNAATVPAAGAGYLDFADATVADAVFEGGIDDDLLVISATEDAPVDFATLEDQPATVTGVVRQMVRRLHRQRRQTIRDRRDGRAGETLDIPARPGRSRGARRGLRADRLVSDAGRAAVEREAGRRARPSADLTGRHAGWPMAARRRRRRIACLRRLRGGGSALPPHGGALKPLAIAGNDRFIPVHQP